MEVDGDEDDDGEEEEAEEEEEEEKPGDEAGATKLEMPTHLEANAASASPDMEDKSPDAEEKGAVVGIPEAPSQAREAPPAAPAPPAAVGPASSSAADPLATLKDLEASTAKV